MILKKITDEILSIMVVEQAKAGRLSFHKVGTWKEIRVGGEHDSGFYLEAVDIEGAARYAQVSYSLLHEKDETKPLAKGLIVSLSIPESELLSRIS